MEGPNATNLKATVTVSAGAKNLVRTSEEVVALIRKGKARPSTSSRQEKLVERMAGNRKPIIGPRDRAFSLHE